MIGFRRLRADEIECRVALVKQSGVQLLLYKDARCDMNILDETVGSMGWQREHKEVKGVVYCGVGIFYKELDEWVWKWDAGAESYTEKEKGEASDSFKRACVNWGIGRELYTSPFIWVKAGDTVLAESDGKMKVRDAFKVSQIEYDERGSISYLVIRNKKGNIVYTYGVPSEKDTPRHRLTRWCEEHDVDLNAVAKKCHLSKESSEDDVQKVLEALENGQERV